MATLNLQEFIDYLNSHVNKSIYVWGAQGQDLKTLTDAKIRSMETSLTYANSAIALKNKRINIEGAKAFDCSGLGMYFFQNLKGYKKTDHSADMLLDGYCIRITKAELRKGDTVFRLDSKGNAYHIGFVVDNELNVVESYGREKGVIKKSLNAWGANYWNGFGRFTFFKTQIVADDKKQPSYKGYEFTRELKYKSPTMSGEDVKALQSLLVAKGVSPGSIDGKFGPNTKKAVQNFQKLNNLKVDGIAGKNTFVALGGKWKTSSTTTVVTYKFSLTKSVKKGTKGTEAKLVQKALKDHGYDLGKYGVDGSFGADSVAALKKFQKDKGRKVDGICGKDTCKALGGKWNG